MFQFVSKYALQPKVMHIYWMNGWPVDWLAEYAEYIWMLCIYKCIHILSDQHISHPFPFHAFIP